VYWTFAPGATTKRPMMDDLNLHATHRLSRAAKGVATLGVGLAMAIWWVAVASGQANDPVSIAVLSVELQNDRAQWAPTSDAERQRLRKIEDIFKSMLEASGKYKFTPVSPSIQERISKDQKLGNCAGCEIQYGTEIGVGQVAWIEVQKVSELILNINVYMASVESGKVIFVKSVDLRGNTDESWQHSMRFLVKRYILPSDESRQK
jgi:hypothetical protein